jgi:molybdate transport system permease protein
VTRQHRPGPPVLLLAPAALGALLLVLPLAGVLARTPWSRLPRLLTSPQVADALLLSLRCSLGSLALCLLLGVPLAWVLARLRFPGRALLRGLVLVPLVLPPVVGGVALLLAFGRRGLLGPVLDASGTVPAFTPWGVVLAEAFVSLPFLVLVLEGAVAGLDPAAEETARTLGAGPLRVFLTVTLPLVRPSLLAAAALAWTRALGEFGATITFAGSLQGRTQTLPLAVYELLAVDPPAAYAVSALLLAVSTAVVVALRSRLVP